eukprot:NODE_321_length_1792_cov_239.566265_g260_i0.p1 GENE.NODE_321_length_1792_cov_239.566265_g260_i0~~NODE_321_length_1792_cov_239.566265_g260_i0.p1  ORF type:complete len:535 (-),score=169.22 NODE_321_length_1792_cov_239.566265_g260_i0:100-1704(-)
MSLSQYDNEPPPSGKVKLETSNGDVIIELWSKECPKACRNFVQLCMEDYYNNTIFHRIVKDYLMQGGDPTGTGNGGDSIYGEPFPTEVHTRLKFNRRGLLAMAGGDNDNGSQFFITLGPCEWLFKKHTIFGKIVANTVFNVVPLGDLETDENERPLFPPKIVKATVLDNPFDDIVPREPIAAPAAPAPTKKKLRKETRLMSFGDDGEQQDDEGETEFASIGMKSSHDLLNDERLKKEAAYSEAELAAIKNREVEEKAKQKKKADFKAKIKDAARGEAGAEVGAGAVAEDVQDLRVPGTAAPNKMPNAKSKSADDDDDDDEHNEKEGQPVGYLQQLSNERAAEAKAEFQRIKLDMLKFKKMKRKEQEESEKAMEDRELSELERRRLQYIKKKSTGAEREQKTVERMRSFSEMLSMTALKQKRAEQENASDEEEVEVPVSVAVNSLTDNPAHTLQAIMDEDSEEEQTDWVKHKLKCPKQKSCAPDDYYVVLDPLEMASEGRKNMQRLKQIRTQQHQQNQRERMLESGSGRKKQKLL